MIFCSSSGETYSDQYVVYDTAIFDGMCLILRCGVFVLYLELM